jgi:hypothetical protein
LVTVGSSTISNQLVSGSIIVKHMKSILEPSLHLRVHGPMRSIHIALQGVVLTSFGSTRPYFLLCLLFIWQDVQDLMYDRIVLCMSFQYIMGLIVFPRRKWPGCWR